MFAWRSTAVEPDEETLFVDLALCTPIPSSTDVHQITAKVQERVLRRAEAQAPGEFRASVCRAVARFDRKNATERHQVAYAERKVAHHSRWHVTKQSDGTYDWTSPTGHRYRYRPPELPAPERPSEPADEDLPPF